MSHLILEICGIAIGIALIILWVYHEIHGIPTQEDENQKNNEWNRRAANKLHQIHLKRNNK